MQRRRTAPGARVASGRAARRTRRRRRAAASRWASVVEHRIGDCVLDDASAAPVVGAVDRGRPRSARRWPRSPAGSPRHETAPHRGGRAASSTSRPPSCPGMTERRNVTAISVLATSSSSNSSMHSSRWPRNALDRRFHAEEADQRSELGEGEIRLRRRRARARARRAGASCRRRTRRRGSARRATPAPRATATGAASAGPPPAAPSANSSLATRSMATTAAAWLG